MDLNAVAKRTKPKNLVQSVSGPYPTVKYVPTGGISPDNLLEYLQFPKVLACGGTWVAKAALISEGKFDEIVQNAREAVEIVNKLKPSAS